VGETGWHAVGEGLLIGEYVGGGCVRSPFTSAVSSSSASLPILVAVLVVDGRVAFVPLVLILSSSETEEVAVLGTPMVGVEVLAFGLEEGGVPKLEKILMMGESEKESLEIEGMEMLDWDFWMGL